MTNQWEKLKQRCDELTTELAQPSLDSSKRHAYQKELSQLTGALDKYQEVASLEKKVQENQGQATQSSDPEMLELFQEEFAELAQQLKEARAELDDLIYPPDLRDNRSVFLEIRAGTGGQEAALFAADLLRMYTNYGLRKNWRVSIEDSSTTDLGGFREIVLYIQGKNVYGHLKKESGVHRVQRVPATETAGRVHTSTATVAVLPEAEEVDVVVNPADLRIDVYRAGGAGGQHVNKTESAVRITHIPTGVVVACQDDRSQHKNKAKAMKILKSRILALQIEQQEAEMSKQRKEQVGAGTRSEKVRTYNFPQNRVTDHQVEVTLNKLDMVIEGYLDEIIDPLIEVARQERKKYSIFAQR